MAQLSPACQVLSVSWVVDLFLSFPGTDLYLNKLLLFGKFFKCDIIIIFYFGFRSTNLMKHCVAYHHSFLAFLDLRLALRAFESLKEGKETLETFGFWFEVLKYLSSI